MGLINQIDIDDLFSSNGKIGKVPVCFCDEPKQEQ